MTSPISFFRFLLVCGILFVSVQAADKDVYIQYVPSESPALDAAQLPLVLAPEVEKPDVSPQLEVLVQQSSALSNVLTGLQQSLVVQKDRELELQKQSNDLSMKVLELGKQSNVVNTRLLIGAGTAVVLVIVLSFWFQMRCFNRVMEITRSLPVPSSYSPMLEFDPSSSTSRLMGAIRLLEHRIEQLDLGKGTIAAGSVTKDMDIIPPASPIVTLSSEEPRNATEIALLLSKGQILLDQERLAEALECFSDVVSLDRNNAEAHLKKGNTLERMDRLEESLESYEEALRLNPKRAVVYVCKARVLAGLHRYDEALSVYDAGLEKNATRSRSVTVTT